MYFFKKKLEEYLYLENISNEVISNAFINLGYEVEKINLVNHAKSVKFAHVLSCKRHPNSEKLSFCKVKTNNKIYDVVCGGKNISKDQIVIHALPGSIVNNKKLDLRKIRGVDSYGMILSLSELLGVNDNLMSQDDKDNIFVVKKFDSNFNFNINPIKYFNLDDTIFDVTILNDRQYAASYKNMAKELAVYLDVKLKDNACKIYETTLKAPNIELELKDNAVMLIVTEAKLTGFGEIPFYVKKFLLLNNIKLNNNLNDLFIYFKLLRGSTGVLIDKTSKVILNNEYINDINFFTSPPVRNKGKNVLFVSFASNQKASLLTVNNVYDSLGEINLKGTGFNDCSLSTLISLATECGFIEKTSPSITLRNKRINSIIKYDYNHILEFIGQEFDFEKIKNRLARLEIFIDKKQAIIPNYRIDILHWQDLVEEIVRLININNLNIKELQIKSQNPLLDKNINIIFDLTQYLVKHNFTEIKTYHLDNYKNVKKFNIFDSKKFYRLKKEYNYNADTFQTSLINGLLKVHNYNYRKKNSEIYLFEISNVYHDNNNNLHLGIIYDDTFFSHKERLPLISETILINVFQKINKVNSKFDIKKIRFVNNDNLIFNPYLSSKIYYNNDFIGVNGELHPSILRENKYIRVDKIKLKLYYLELNLSIII